MTDNRRIVQSQDELERQLADQIDFLRASAEAFDRGLDGEAKRLAVSIRILCHDTKASLSLLGQLHRLDKKFVSTALPYDARSAMTHNGLAMMAMKGRETKYIAMLDTVPMRRPMGFAEWWGEIVFVDDRKESFTRRSLILAVTNQDGGAHVDPTLSEAYARLSRQNSLGWVTQLGKERLPIPKPERAAVRQIAHEVLSTLVPKYRKEQTEDAAMFAGGMVAMQGIPAELQRPKPGRNDPCPCGSGKKFKRCHGAV